MKTLTGFVATVVLGTAVVIGTMVLLISCDKSDPNAKVFASGFPTFGEIVAFGPGDLIHYLRGGEKRFDFENIQVGDSVALWSNIQTMERDPKSSVVRYCMVTYVDHECCSNPTLRCDCFRATCVPPTVSGAN